MIYGCLRNELGTEPVAEKCDREVRKLAILINFVPCPNQSDKNLMVSYGTSRETLRGCFVWEVSKLRAARGRFGAAQRHLKAGGFLQLLCGESSFFAENLSFHRIGGNLLL